MSALGLTATLMGAATGYFALFAGLCVLFDRRKARKQGGTAADGATEAAQPHTGELAAEAWGRDLQDMSATHTGAYERWHSDSWAAETGEWDITELREMVGSCRVEDEFLGALDLGAPEAPALFLACGRDWVESWIPAGLTLPDDSVIEGFVERWALASV